MAEQDIPVKIHLVAAGRRIQHPGEEILPHNVQTEAEIAFPGRGMAQHDIVHPAVLPHPEKEIAVQIGGKLKTTVVVPMDAPDEKVLEIATADEKIARLMEGMQIVRTIVVKNKLINLILKPNN